MKRTMKMKKWTAAVTAGLMIAALGAGSCALAAGNGPMGFNTNYTAAASNQTEPYFTEAEEFTDRDLEQEADLSEAVNLTPESGKETVISEAGVYVISGTAEEATIRVEAGSEDKVQLVLDGVSITNSNFPCIYVVNADKVFVTLAGENSLTVSGSFRSDGDTNTDGAIFSKDDLVLNGSGSVTISSTDNGIVCKDDLKITGGSWNITATSKAIEANDSIRMAGGTLNLNAGTDGLHAENNDDNAKGYIYISGGSLTVTARDDAVHATTVFQMDDGTLTAAAAEGIEATVIQINGGTVSIQASDDGINAGQKSTAYTPTVIFNGGSTTIAMGAGDTDGVDANGNIYVNGGTVNVTGNSSFDYDGTAELNGGTLIVNGQQLSSIPNQMMGGMGGQGGFGGGMGGHGGGFGGGRGR